jgi:hypothetical protein
MADEAVSVQHDSGALEIATDALSAAQEELAAFASDLTARRVLGEKYHEALEARNAAVDQAQVEMQRILAAMPSAIAVECYDELPIEDRKRILGSSIDAVIVRRGHARIPIEDRITILWRGEGPNDLPRRGCDNGPVRPYEA